MTIQEKKLICPICPCLIHPAPPGPIHVNNPHSTNAQAKVPVLPPLPFHMPTSKHKTTEEEGAEYIHFENVHAFYNISVAKPGNVTGIRYLACADCETGPVGWMDEATGQCYIEAGRCAQDYKKMNEKKRSDMTGSS